MNNILINLENINFAYKKNVPILNGLSMQINKNSIFAILGHNGAGKTTILRLIAGLIKPQKGNIVWEIKDNKNICFMPEGLGLYPRLSGYDNLKIRLLTYNKEVSKNEIINILEKNDLSEHANKQVGLWSTGMKRRLSLVCALMTEPSLLLLDEPFTGIDPVSQKIMQKMIQEKSSICTIIFSSHDLSLVKNISTDISIIKNGKHEFYTNKREDLENIDKIYFEKH